MKKKNLFGFSALLLIFGGVGYSLMGVVAPETMTTNLTATTKTVKTTFTIEEFSDADYPDNPDIGFRASNYGHDYFEKGQLIAEKDNRFSFEFYSESPTKDTIRVGNLDLSEYIPTIPHYLKGKEEYISYLSVINQEWNRNQIRYNASQFESTNKAISRVDIARNCLNAYLWEIIVYTKEAGKEVPIHHGWFDFPHDLYAQLFKAKNGVDFAKYQQPLENWVDPESKEVNLTALRTVTKEIPSEYKDLSTTMYPMEKARKKKAKEIIYPERFELMRDLQNDSTLYATFSPPGLYKRAEPRTTELGRFYNFKSLTVNKITSKANGEKGLFELAFTFMDKENKRTTKLFFGGLDFADLPSLDASKANNGKARSMGFGNHPFYETYEEHQALHTYDNPYYAFLSNEKNEWLDSHKVGIDGPILHLDEKDKNVLHVWLLSFERHSLVGHYVVNLNKKS